MSPFNHDDKVVGVTYDGEWVVSFILADAGGRRPAVELPLRVGRGIAEFLREIIADSTGIQFEPKPDGSWEVSV